jgi:hypothetical protein
LFHKRNQEDPMANKGGTAKSQSASKGLGAKAAIIAGVGAACALAVGALFRWRKTHDDTPPAPALKGGGAHGPVGASGNVRPAGRKAMRDPPAEWDEVDEAADESFPASDPPNLSKHVD